MNSFEVLDENSVPVQARMIALALNEDEKLAGCPS
jgi:hypothetical protein